MKILLWMFSIMALEFVAVSGCTLSHNATPVSGGSFSITSTPDIKVKKKNTPSKGFYFGNIAFNFAGGNCTSPPCDPGTVFAAGSIPATAAKVKKGGIAVMRENDSVEAVFAGTLSGSPVSIGTYTVKVNDPGQDKIKAQ